MRRRAAPSAAFRRIPLPAHILQIIHSPDPGGVLALSHDIVAGLEKAGHRVDTCFVADRVGAPRLTKLRGLLRTLRLTVFGGYDTVIAYQAAPSITVGLAGLFTRSPQRIVHQTTIPPATNALARLLDRIVGTIGLYPINIVNTVSTHNEFTNYPAAYRKRLLLIEHGLPKPEITRTRAETLQRHRIPDDRKILLNTGRLVEDKNQATIIRALPELPGVRFVVAGQGEAHGAYLKLAGELGVADRVHLLGALPHEEAVELYGAADLFVFPTRNETFGISAVEAVLLRLPTIVSDIGVLREVLRVDGASPVAFVPADDVDAWQRAIVTWLAEPPPAAELEAFGQAIERKYSRERMLEGYLKLIRSPGGKGHRDVPPIAVNAKERL